MARGIFLPRLSVAPDVLLQGPRTAKVSKLEWIPVSCNAEVFSEKRSRCRCYYESNCKQEVTESYTSTIDNMDNFIRTVPTNRQFLCRAFGPPESTHRTIPGSRPSRRPSRFRLPFSASSPSCLDRPLHNLLVALLSLLARVLPWTQQKHTVSELPRSLQANGR